MTVPPVTAKDVSQPVQWADDLHAFLDPFAPAPIGTFGPSRINHQWHSSRMIVERAEVPPA
jgi:hypothetical protein